MKTLAKFSGLLCTTVAICSMASAASAGNLVRNGSFEVTTPGVNPGEWYYWGEQGSGPRYGGPDSNVPYWTNINKTSTIEIRNSVSGTAQHGSNFAEIDSHAYDKSQPVGFFQDIVTEATKKYKLSFYYGPRKGYNANDNKFNVSFGGINQEIDAGIFTNNASAWQKFEGYIMGTAGSPTTRLQFDLVGIPNTLGANIDNIHVTAVPEPLSVLGLAAFGAVGAASTVRKRMANRG